MVVWEPLRSLGGQTVAMMERAGLGQLLSLGFWVLLSLQKLRSSSSAVASQSSAFLSSFPHPYYYYSFTHPCII